MASVALAGIDKTIGTQTILRGIDLKVEDGEFIVMVGPSGCGKSTLLRIIAGLDHPSAGHVFIDNTIADDLEPKDRGVAMVFQSYALYPHLSVYENLAFALKIAKCSKTEVTALVERAAKILDISHLLDRKPSQLSGGQRQRVAIGRAIVRTPKLFLLDEPLSNLDAGLRVHMRHEFAKLHRSLKTTTLYVTHDQIEAMTLADRIVVMNAGVIEQIGTPTQIYERPENLFVAGFLGAPKMNLLSAQVRKLNRSGPVLQLKSGESVCIACDGQKLKLGDEVTLGLRPEALRSQERQNRLELCVDMVETLGSTNIVYGHMNSDSVQIAASVDSSLRPESGSKIEFGFNPVAAHVFDADGKIIQSAF